MPQIGAARLVLSVTTLVAMCASAAGASARTQGGSPTLSVALSDTVFRPGSTMTLNATLAPGATSSPVDAYVVVQLPTGQYLSLQLGGALVPGIVPIARGIVPAPYQATLAQYIFSGVEPLGSYTWYAVLTKPGTLEFVTALQQVVFTFDISTPETTRSQLATALKTGDLREAIPLLGNMLGDVVGQLPPGIRVSVAEALETCVVDDSHDGYEVCAGADGRFAFMMVRDERRIWRVIAW